MHRKSWGALLILFLFLSGCSGKAHAGAIGNPEAGKALFEQTTIHQAPACATCHATEPNIVIVGPSLAGIASRASERVSGMSPVDYLYESITAPDRFIVEGFEKGIMYQDFKSVLTTQEIEDLIAYLLTLK